MRNDVNMTNIRFRARDVEGASGRGEDYAEASEGWLDGYDRREEHHEELHDVGEEHAHAERD